MVGTPASVLPVEKRVISHPNYLHYHKQITLASNSSVFSAVQWAQWISHRLHSLLLSLPLRLQAHRFSTSSEYSTPCHILVSVFWPLTILLSPCTRTTYLHASIPSVCIILGRGSPGLFIYHQCHAVGMKEGIHEVVVRFSLFELPHTPPPCIERKEKLALLAWVSKGIDSRVCRQPNCLPAFSIQRVAYLKYRFLGTAHKDSDLIWDGVPEVVHPGGPARLGSSG